MTIKKLVVIFFAVTCSVFAASPKTVTHSSKTDFERGTLTNVAILQDGTLTTAPVKTKLLDTGEPFVWSMAEDSKGNMYLGTGNEGKIFKLTPKGDSTLVLKVDELFIFALLVDGKDNLYAATSPNGRVYKITPAGQSSTFFDPEATYIWDLALDADGNILVATGEQAFIYAVSPGGNSRVLFDAEENHVRSVVVQDETVYAGTSGNGFIYRLAPETSPFVIFDPQMEEVNEIIVAQDGTLYASAFGEPITMPTPRGAAQSQQSQNNDNASNEDEQEDDAVESQAISLESIVRSRGVPTSLFRISPDGYAKDLWIGADAKIQSIYPYGDKVLVGSGSSGKLLTVDDNGDLAILMENGESHITAFLKNKQNKIVFTTSNLGRVYQMEETAVDTASFISETIDAGLPAQWGVLSWKGNESAASTRFFTRSGNTEQPSQTWSDWTAVQKDGDDLRIKSPNARFVQWKCELNNQNAAVKEVSITYLQKNIAPTVSSVFVHRANDFYEAKSNSSSRSEGIIFPAPLPNKQTKKGFRSVDWLFDDPNFDALTFSLYYRRVGATAWRNMTTELDVNVFAWDSAQMADGEYEIKIVASDQLANPENVAMTGEKISDPFIVDNSGPAIKTGNNEKSNVLTVRISDEWSRLASVEVSIDAAEWQSIYPVDGIIDSKSEVFEIKNPKAGEHDIAIKASDDIGNTTVAHTSVK